MLQIEELKDSYLRLMSVLFLVKEKEKKKKFNCMPCLKIYKKSDMVSELEPINNANYTKHSVGCPQFLDA
jgi:hypothetical protein